MFVASRTDMEKYDASFFFLLPFLTLMVLGREEGVFDRGTGKSLDSLEY
jgi:hypothetical protein